MRSLTIKRRKAFAGSLGKDLVFIEDTVLGDTTVNGVRCRKLGELKNGEQQTFYVDENAARVFIVGGKVRKRRTYDSYNLPEGDEDIFLEGTHIMDVMENEFRFNNGTLGIDSKNAKKTILGISILVAACIFGTIFGRYIGDWLVSGRTAAAKDFTVQGMTITLTENFKEDSVLGQTASYASKDMIVLCLREPFALIPGADNMTVRQYAGLVLQANKDKAATLQQFGDHPGFEFTYTSPESNRTFRYRLYTYKGEDAFWTIQFVTNDQDFTKLESKIAEYAESVRFKP